MLSDRTLLIVALCLTLLGIIALYLLFLSAELPLEDLTAVVAGRESTSVRVHARVVSVRHAGNGSVTLLTLAEEVTRPAVVFGDVNVSPGMTVDVEGEVRLYEDAPELVVSRLTALPVASPALPENQSR